MRRRRPQLAQRIRFIRPSPHTTSREAAGKQGRVQGGTQGQVESLLLSVPSGLCSPCSLSCTFVSPRHETPAVLSPTFFLAQAHSRASTAGKRRAGPASHKAKSSGPVLGPG